MAKNLGGITLTISIVLMLLPPLVGSIMVWADTEPPIIREVIAYPNPQETGGYVNITCTVLDDIRVDTANVIITYPNSTTYNLTMTPAPLPSPHLMPTHHYNATYTLLGTYHFYIWANDTSNNQNQSLLYTFEILEEDLIPPVITTIHDAPDPQITGLPVNITCHVTDNTGVADVRVNIRYPNYYMVNTSMTNIPSNTTYYHESVYTLLGTYYYAIWATDSFGNNVHSSMYTFIITEEPGPDITVEKKVKQDCHWVDCATVYVGDTVDFMITITNTGMVTLADVRVADTLPVFLTYNYDADPLPSFESDHEIQWSLGSLNSGESRELTFSATVIAAGCGENEAYACSCIGVEDFDTVAIIAHDPGGPLIQVEKKVFNGCLWVDNITATVGESLFFNITITNTGSITLTYVEVTDTLPVFLTYNYDADPLPSFESDHEIQWSLGSLNSGESRELTFSVTIILPGCGYNQAYVTTCEAVNDTDTVKLTCEMDGHCDDTPPLVSIDKPSRYLYIADRAILPTLWKPIILGGITVEVIAMDDQSGVDRVEFIVGNDIMHVSTEWPYEWVWNENAFGFYSLKARAYDNAGNSDIDSIDVYIINF